MQTGLEKCIILSAKLFSNFLGHMPLLRRRDKREGKSQWSAGKGLSKEEKKKKS